MLSAEPSQTKTGEALASGKRLVGRKWGAEGAGRREAAFRMHGGCRMENMTQRRVSRLPPLKDPESDPVLKELFDESRARGGDIINLHLTLGHAPHVAKASRAMAYALRFHAKAPRALRELAIMRTAQIVGSEYEWNQHQPMALAVGIFQAQLDALATWRDSDLFDERERALLAYADAATRGAVDDATYEAFARHFTPQEIVELTVCICNYYGTGLLMRALKIEVETDGRRAASG
jgi:alkylhydroperoxidase family enzyme